MIAGMSGGKKIVTDPKTLEQFNEARVIVRIDSMRSLTSLIGFDRNGSAMGIRPRYHHDLVSSQAMIAGNDISRKVRSCDIPYVNIRIGIRPGYSN
jgi:hypothetical protein